MAMAQGIFKRYEKKYLLTQEIYTELRNRLEEHMEMDSFGKHTICNIYYDTGDYSLIRTSIEKPLYKEKFRVRSYGTPKETDMVYLELKKKYEGVVYKRRVPVQFPKANEYLRNEERPEDSCQILHEINYFFEQNRPVPKVYIAYDRIAMFGKEDPELRITFDTNMRYRDYDLDLAKGDYGSPIIDDELYLMEVKIQGAMPFWMARIFTELEIYPTSFSKYGTCYKKDLFYKGPVYEQCEEFEQLLFRRNELCLQTF